MVMVKRKIMTLPVDTESISYRFYKTLHDDVHLISNEYGEWDIDFKNGDWVNVSGFDSLVNACVIAILTRFNELDFMDLYDGFGCRIHEVVKQNKGRNAQYRLELFVTEVLQNMRRVDKVNWVRITDSPDNELWNYKVHFNITCISDEDIDGEIVEESFTI